MMITTTRYVKNKQDISISYHKERTALSANPSGQQCLFANILSKDLLLRKISDFSSFKRHWSSHVDDREQI